MCRRTDRSSVHAQEGGPAVLVVKWPRERTAELLGSLLGSAAAIAGDVRGDGPVGSPPRAPPRPEQCAWLALVSVAGAWAVLVGGKVLGRAPTAIRCCGGSSSWSSAWGWGRRLGRRRRPARQPPAHAGFSVAQDSANLRLPSGFYDDGRPLTMAYMACFGTLFLLLRWWRQVDPWRESG